MEKKKLLFITTRLFWPTNSGRKVVLYNYCKGLYEKFGYDIYLYSFLEYEQTKECCERKPYFIKEVKVAKDISKFSKVFNVFTKSLFLGWPFQNSLYYSKANKKEIENFASLVRPDVVFVDMIRLAPYYSAIKNINCKKVLDLDDLLSLRYERQLNADNKASFLGCYSGFASKSEKRFLNNRFIRNKVLKSEAKRVRKSEISYSKLYDNIVFVSENETRILNQRLGEKKAVTVRMGVDYEYLSNGSVKKENGAIAFMGNLNASANVDSLFLMAEKVLPKLDFDYRLYIVGSCPFNVSESFKNNSNIIFLGQVEDFRPILKKCEVFLSPIAYGTGIKTKILEAMSMGLAVVTNSVGSEGIDCSHEKDIFIYDDYVQIAECVNLLHENVDLRNTIGLNAASLMGENYQWDIIYDSFSFLNQ